MKIRPKTFQSACELLRNGYNLYLNNEKQDLIKINNECIDWGWIYWINSRVHGDDVWLKCSDWYFKK